MTSQHFLFGKTVWCRWIFSLRVMQVLYWPALDWMGWRCYDWTHKNLTEQWMFACVWLVSWTQTSRIFEWFCLMHACLLQSARQIHWQHFPMWFQCEPKWQAYCGFGWAKEVPKRMWNSIPMSSHRCRKVCMDMPCGRTMLAISTSHHPYLGAPVESVLTWEMYHGPPGMTILHVKYYEYVITQLGTGTDHFQHFRHGNFRVLNFESTQLQFRPLFFGGDGIILYF